MCEEIPMCHGSFGWFLQEDQAGYKLATTWPVVYYWGGWYLILSYIYIYLYHFRKHTDSTSKEVVHRLASNFCFRNIFRHFGCGPNRRLLKKNKTCWYVLHPHPLFLGDGCPVGACLCDVSQLQELFAAFAEATAPERWTRPKAVKVPTGWNFTRGRCNRWMKALGWLIFATGTQQWLEYIVQNLCILWSSRERWLRIGSWYLVPGRLAMFSGNWSSQSDDDGPERWCLVLDSKDVCVFWYIAKVYPQPSLPSKLGNWYPIEHMFCQWVVQSPEMLVSMKFSCYLVPFNPEADPGMIKFNSCFP